MAPATSVTRRTRRGATAVEFALTAPVLLAVGFGAIDMAWYMHTATAVQDIVRQGVRIGSMQEMDDGFVGTCSACEAGAADFITTGLTDYGLDAAGAVTTATTQLVDGAWALQVDVTVPYESFSHGLVPMPRRIETRLGWRIENQ